MMIYDDQLVPHWQLVPIWWYYWILPLFVGSMMINLFRLGHFFHVDRIVSLREGVGAGMLEMAGKALEKLSVDTGAACRSFRWIGGVCCTVEFEKWQWVNSYRYHF
jgi:DMSO reductase anchor subunit